jgi:hypothetical protein
MTITNYTNLRAAIADWLLRDDLTAVIPSFIALAETQMQREIRHHKMVATSTLSLSSRYTNLPADWLQTTRLELVADRSYRMELVSIDDLLQLRQGNGASSGRPQYFSHVGEQLEVFPAPDGIYSAELLYHQKIPVLSDVAPTNWLLTDYPDAYLYGALMQAAPYLDDDQKMQVWAGLYASAVNSINAETKKARYSGAGMRIRINSY